MRTYAEALAVLAERNTLKSDICDAREALRVLGNVRTPERELWFRRLCELQRQLGALELGALGPHDIDTITDNVGTVRLSRSVRCF